MVSISSYFQPKSSLKQDDKKRKSEQDSAKSSIIASSSKRRKATSNASPASANKNQAIDAIDAAQSIYDTLPKVDLDNVSTLVMEEGKKFNFYAAKAQQAESSTMDSTSITIPETQLNCCAGLTFVFTGIMPGLDRDEAKEIVQKNGGKVVGAPSKSTSFIVIGENAGPSKIAKIKKNGNRVLNRDTFLELLARLPPNGGEGGAAKKYADKIAKEEELAKKEAEKMQREEEKEEEKEKERIKSKKLIEKSQKIISSPTTTTNKKNNIGASKEEPINLLSSQESIQASQENSKINIAKNEVEGLTPSQQQELSGKITKANNLDSELWTVRYAPKSLKDICGNKAVIERFYNWLKNWKQSASNGFKDSKIPGSKFRAVLIHGPPGVGKTTSAHLVAKLLGYDAIETNASDTRSKNLIKARLSYAVGNESIMGYFNTKDESNIPNHSQPDSSKKNIVFIMDEIDGMSSGDVGGVSALAALCRTTRVPLILICNDKSAQKMRPLDFVTYDLPFRRPDVNAIRSRIMSIAFKEKMKLSAQAVDQLTMGTRSDIRQIINILSTYKRTAQAMDFDTSKNLTSAWEKTTVLKPFDIAKKFLSPEAHSIKSTMNDKIELFFNDFAFSPLMIQENYLSVIPIDLPKGMSQLDAVAKAADFISDGDLVDVKIHGSQQQWSLLPLFGVLSTVAPSEYMYGRITSMLKFTSYLGNLSRMNKMLRFLQELRAHMRLVVSADKQELRLSYIPAFFNSIITPLLGAQGIENIQKIIEIMDSYYLVKEEWEEIAEVGSLGRDYNELLKKVATQTKRSFTLNYNKMSHPIAYMGGGSVVDFSKKGSGPKADAPDLEEALDEEDTTATIDDKNNNDDDEDISKAKDVKVVKTIKKTKAAGTSKTKAKPKPKPKRTKK